MTDNNQNINVNVTSTFEASKAKPNTVQTATIDLLLEPIKQLFVEAVKDLVDRFHQILFDIDTSQIENFPEEFRKKQEVLNAIVDQRREFFENNPIEDFKQQLKDVFVDTGIVLKIEDLIAEKPELKNIFGPIVRKEINDAVANFIENQKGLIDKALEKKRDQQEGLETLAKFFEDATLEDLPQKLTELFKKIITNIPTSDQNLNPEQVVPPDLKNKLDEQTNAIGQQNEQIKIGKELIDQYGGGLSSVTGIIALNMFGTIEGAEAQSEFLIATENTAEQLQNEAESLSNAESSLGGLVSQSGTFVGLQGQINQTVGEGATAFEGAGAAAAGFGETLDNVDTSGGFFDGIKQGFVDFVESVGESGELIANFFANTLSQISANFSDLLFNVIKGNFDSLSDLASSAFDAILKSFLDLVSAIATRQIVVSIGGLFGLGGSAAAGGGGDLLGGILGGAGSLFGGIGGLFGGGSSAAAAVGTGFASTGFGAGFSAIGTLAPEIAAIGGIGATGAGAVPAATGFLASVGGAIPVIGAVLAAAAIALPFIIGAFQKTPRLDLDFDQFRDEFGKSLGIAAQVQDFLDEDLFNDEIFNRSVSRQAGLGLGSELPNVIREAIEGQINVIQDIINQLPADLAAQLNESLLNTSVDIESEVKGDRLLEFDETKNIKEKFQKFINGDLQARFLFSIRDFFVGAFESLGVLGSAAQDFIDGEFEKFQGLSREERIEAGQELLQDFQTLTDAFNVINNNGADSIGATVNSIKNLSNSLEFDGVPSIEELDAGLEELISAACFRQGHLAV